MSEDKTDEFLAHYGVLGMKWGRTKQAARSFYNKPNAAKALLLGSYGNKDSYTSMSALRKRRQAGQLRVTAWVMAPLSVIGNLAVSGLGGTSTLGIGAAAVSRGLNVAGSLSMLAAQAYGTVGAHEESKYRKENA